MRTFRFLFISSLVLLSTATWSWEETLTANIGTYEKASIRRYVVLSSSYTHDYITNTGGRKAGPRNIGALDLYLDSDFRNFSNVSGEVVMHFSHINATDRRGDIGDTQVASNIDVPSRTNRMADLYYQHYWGKHFLTLVGINDISTEFNVTPSSLNFLNGGFGTDTTFAVSGTNGPSIYPATTFGLRARYEPTDQLVFLFGIYDGDPGDATTLSQFSYRVGLEEGLLLVSEISYSNVVSKLGVGSWGYSKQKERFAKKNELSLDVGTYGIFEHQLVPNVTAFLRVGYANPRVNLVSSTMAFGFVYEGVFHTKKSLDEIGIGLSRANFSREFLGESVSRNLPRMPLSCITT